MRAPARRRLFGLAMALILGVLGGESAFASPNRAEAAPEPATLDDLDGVEAAGRRGVLKPGALSRLVGSVVPIVIVRQVEGGNHGYRSRGEGEQDQQQSIALHGSFS